MPFELQLGLLLAAGIGLCFWLMKVGHAWDGVDRSTIPSIWPGLSAALAGGIAGALAALIVIVLLRDQDRFVVDPIAQAVGFVVMMIVGWPLFQRKLPVRQFGFVGSTLMFAGVMAVVTAARIAFRTG